jgi:hypothetical protein
MAKKRVNSNSVELTRGQRLNLTTRQPLLGEGHAFGSEAERRQAWQVHGQRLLEDGRPGLRPGAYWSYERPEIDAQRIPHETDVQLLYRFGLLTPDEIETLRQRKGQTWPPRPATGRDPREILYTGLRDSF